MYNLYDNDVKLVNRLHEERRTQLARTYADGQADLVTLKLWAAKLATIVGSALLRSGRSLGTDAQIRQERRQELARVRANFEY